MCAQILIHENMKTSSDHHGLDITLIELVYVNNNDNTTTISNAP